MDRADSVWLAPPADALLPPDVVHVWRVELDPPEAAVVRLARPLSADEQQRAARFQSVALRRRFVVAHGVLRLILGRYTGSDPAALLFRNGPHGKPALRAPDTTTSLHFNLSHADDLALIAVARDRELGVDIERRRPLPDAAAIADRFFSLSERSALRAMPADRRLEYFYTLWTCKEAYIKARGDGLALPLDQFEVALEADGAAALMRTGDNPDGAARWSLRTLRAALGYAAALAVEGHGWRIATWQWTSA